MNVTLDKDGVLAIVPTTETEAYALGKWGSDPERVLTLRPWRVHDGGTITISGPTISASSWFAGTSNG